MKILPLYNQGFIEKHILLIYFKLLNLTYFLSLDTYEKACLKLKTAEDTSDLQTESEQQPARLRTKRFELKAEIVFIKVKQKYK